MDRMLASEAEDSGSTPDGSTTCRGEFVTLTIPKPSAILLESVDRAWRRILEMRDARLLQPTPSLSDSHGPIYAH